MLLKYKQDIEINLKLNTDVNKILFYEIMTGGQLANRHVLIDHRNTNYHYNSFVPAFNNCYSAI